MLAWLAILASIGGQAVRSLDAPVSPVPRFGPDSVASGVSFSATGGSVTPNGLYVAGPSGGTYQVFAAAGGAKDTATVHVAVAAAKPPAPAQKTAASPAGGGAKVPFGLFNVDPTGLAPPFDVAVVAGDPVRLLGVLAAARRNGSRVIVNFAGGKYQNNYGLDGTFSIDAWEARVSRFTRLDLSPYIADGTLMANYLIDEPHHKASWGRVVPYETLEQMAQYSKSIWPTLPTIIRTRVSWLGQAPFKWTYLDAGWAQYSANRGDVTAFRDTEVAAAAKTGLSLLFSLNVSDGGEVVPGCYAGTRKFWCAMTAAELARFGSVLASAPTACGLTLWQYDREYLARSDVQASVQELARIVGAHAPVPCRRR